MKWAFLILAIVFNASANIILKLAAQRSVQVNGLDSLIKRFFEPYQLLGIVCFGFALIAYSYSLSKFELSVAYPLMTSLGLIVVSLFSLFYLNEVFTIYKTFGILLIILGVVFVTK